MFCKYLQEKDKSSSEDQENNRNDENMDSDAPNGEKKANNDEDQTMDDGLKGPKSVRDVYQRGCGIHCPNKALIRMKWAEFEESFDNILMSREILEELIKRHPLLIEATMHLIGKIYCNFQIVENKGGLISESSSFWFYPPEKCVKSL